MIFPEVKIHQPDSFEDYRGELYTIFKQEYNELMFNHDKVAISRQNVLRGLHGDSKSWKLITCLAGEIYLVVVDNRPESPNYLKWDSVVLTSKNKKSVLVPPMFANGHLVLSQEATFFYKWAYSGNYPDVQDQFSLNWNDPKLNIHWPINNPILSDRDKNSKFIQ
jgi:dTDP-4-dehydrorhamnose 3,5-epimerase